MKEDIKDKIIQVPVEDILPNRFQPRIAFDEKELNELSNSILKYGVIQPIVLRKMGNKYEIIAGERRYRASMMAGLKTIPAIMNNTDDNTSAEIALLENLQRKNLTVIEEAKSFKKLLDKGFTQEDIANKLGISQSSIANKMRLLNLPKQVQDALLFNKISERHARSLLSLDNTDTQIELLDRITKEKLTVRQTEDEISHLLRGNKEEEEIPEDIKKYIEPPIDNKYVANRFIEKVPDVVNIDNQLINPFQVRFEDSVKRIKDEVENQDESFYDRIINDDLRKMEQKNNKEQHVEKVNVEKPQVQEISKVISNVRNFVKGINGENIKTEELDLEDRYRIVIEIMKDA